MALPWSAQHIHKFGKGFTDNQWGRETEANSLMDTDRILEVSPIIILVGQY